MIEGFAEGSPSSFYALGDWQLEMNRVLGLVRRGRIILAQSYLSAADTAARGFVLGSYLLIKGSRTFLNMDVGAEPQWFPEYGVALGPPLQPPPVSVDALRTSEGLYTRRYSHGIVAVNPDTRAHRLTLAAPAKLVRPIGGGALSANADTRGWGLQLLPVGHTVDVPPHGGVVLLSS
jgi:hypothetical protein